MKLNDAYIKVEYRLEREGFDNVPALIRYYVGNRKPVSHVGLLVFRRVFFFLIKNILPVDEVVCVRVFSVFSTGPAGFVQPPCRVGLPFPETFSLESLSKRI